MIYVCLVMYLFANLICNVAKLVSLAKCTRWHIVSRPLLLFELFLLLCFYSQSISAKMYIRSRYILREYYYSCHALVVCVNVYCCVCLSFVNVYVLISLCGTNSYVFSMYILVLCLCFFVLPGYVD